MLHNVINMHRRKAANTNWWDENHPFPPKNSAAVRQWVDDRLGWQMWGTDLPPCESVAEAGRCHIPPPGWRHGHGFSKACPILGAPCPHAGKAPATPFTAPLPDHLPFCRLPVPRIVRYVRTFSFLAARRGSSISVLVTITWPRIVPHCLPVRIGVR